MSDAADNADTDDADSVELVMTRLFDAPRELVYQAFVDPDQLAQWFGPVGFSVPRDTIDIDPRVGGPYRYVMVSDDDPEMRAPIDARFTEIVENELIAGIEDWEGVPGQEGTSTNYLRLEFHDEDGKTRLVVRQGRYTPEMEDMARQGWESSFTKLDEVLAGA
ncbi:MAG TPA: SRPBCC domain-containing protein [Acidimicrobiales bacterium]|nr:SRPBCC domain-containing protein [Acidimicrobiales bacterium]